MDKRRDKEKGRGREGKRKGERERGMEMERAKRVLKYSEEAFKYRIILL